MNTLRKLHIPLYLYFALIILAGQLLVWGFETYSKLQFEEFVHFLDRTVGSVEVASGREEAMRGEFREKIERESGTSPPERFVSRFGLSFEKKIENTYTLYRLKNWGNFLIFLIILWMLPVYRFHFSDQHQVSSKVEKRVINLPILLFFIPWAAALWELLFRIVFHYQFLGTLHHRIYGIYIVSFLIFGSLVSYMNLGITNRYINNRIATAVFTGQHLYRMKQGSSIGLSMRITLLIISLAIIPLLINLYIPIAFNHWMIADIRSGEGTNITELAKVALPLLAMILVSIYFMILQLSSIFSFRKSIQFPIHSLIERMQQVSRGDFSTRSSVLASDEIGTLKAHFNMMVEGLAERERIRDIFGKYVSMEIAEKLMDSSSIDFSGDEIETTVMFCDIRDFTPLSEKLSPKDLIAFLNTYLSYMVNPIRDNRGVINKFLGDAVMAIFSPVFGVEDHTTAALHSALGMRQALDSFNQLESFPTIYHGVGVHTGTLIAGNVGAEDRLEYTVIGDTVNIASRIESQTKVFGTDILLSKDVHDRLDQDTFVQFTFRPTEPVIMKGKSYPIQLYMVEKKVSLA